MLYKSENRIFKNFYHQEIYAYIINNRIPKLNLHFEALFNLSFVYLNILLIKNNKTKPKF